MKKWKKFKKEHEAELFALVVTVAVAIYCVAVAAAYSLEHHF